MVSSSARGLSALLLLLGLPVAGFLLGRPGTLRRADFVFVLPKEAGSIDPAYASSFADGMLVHALFEGLMRIDPITLRAEPAAARSCTVSEDGRTYTFVLREDAAWSDGAPLRAQDFVYAWRRILDPATASGSGGLFRPIEGAESGEPSRLGVTAQDPGTFVVRVKEACPYLPALTAHFAFMPVREDVVRAHGERWTEPGNLVGNGPYTLELRRLRDRVRLRRNPRWHGADGVGLEVIDALAVDSSSTALNLFLTGDVDWVNRLPPLAIPHLHGRPELHLAPLFATNFLRMNVTRPPLDDVRVRRALDRALDRSELTTYVYREGEQPARSLVHPSLPGYVPAQAPSEDVGAARALLAEAGFPGGVGFPELELLFATDEAARRAAEAIAARLRDVLGVRIRPVPQELKVTIDSQKSLRYDVCLASWVGDYLDATTFLDIFRAGSVNNRTGFADVEYDALLDRAAREPDATRRAALLHDAENRLLERGPIALVAFRGQANAIQSWVAGFRTNLLDWHPLERLGGVRP